MRSELLASLALLGLALPALGDPVPVPLTRDDVKKALEDSKSAKPRLPLPPPTEEEKAREAEVAKARAAAAAAKTELPRSAGFGIVNNGRMRALYLSDYNTGGSAGPVGFSRDPDPVQTLDPAFRVMMFWIVSRGNKLHVLPRPPGVRPGDPQGARGRDRRPRRRLVRVRPPQARRVRLREEGELRAVRDRRRRRRRVAEALQGHAGHRDPARGGRLQRDEPLDRAAADHAGRAPRLPQADLGEVLGADQPGRPARGRVVGQGVRPAGLPAEAGPGVARQG